MVYTYLDIYLTLDLRQDSNNMLYQQSGNKVDDWTNTQHF